MRLLVPTDEGVHRYMPAGVTIQVHSWESEPVLVASSHEHCRSTMITAVARDRAASSAQTSRCATTPSQSPSSYLECCGTEGVLGTGVLWLKVKAN